MNLNIFFKIFFVAIRLERTTDVFILIKLTRGNSWYIELPVSLDPRFMAQEQVRNYIYSCC